MMTFVRDDGKVSVPRPNAQWGAVIDSIYNLDVQRTYQQLVEELALAEDERSVGHIIKAANVADMRAYEARRLVRAAKLESEKVQHQIDVELGTMREQARSELQEERREGKRSKAPTLEEVADRVRKRWPDRYRRLNEERSKMHGAVRACEGLEESWRGRAQRLQALMRIMRR